MAYPDRTHGYLVECYWPGVTPEKLADTEKRVRAEVSALRRRGRKVTFLGSILVPDDESVFCLFDGAGADVRAASEQAGVPFGRVLESLRSHGMNGEEEEEEE